MSKSQHLWTITNQLTRLNSACRKKWRNKNFKLTTADLPSRTQTNYQLSSMHYSEHRASGISSGLEVIASTITQVIRTRNLSGYGLRREVITWQSLYRELNRKTVALNPYLISIITMSDWKLERERCLCSAASTQSLRIAKVNLGGRRRRKSERSDHRHSPTSIHRSSKSRTSGHNRTRVKLSIVEEKKLMLPIRPNPSSSSILMRLHRTISMMQNCYSLPRLPRLITSSSPTTSATPSQASSKGKQVKYEGGQTQLALTTLTPTNRLNRSRNPNRNIY